MNIQRNRAALVNDVSRRQAIAGIVVAFGSLAIGSRAMGDAPETMVETPTTKENQARTSIHQDVAFKASSQRIYEALLDSKVRGGQPRSTRRRVASLNCSGD
jgi:hypothetical protein